MTINSFSSKSSQVSGLPSFSSGLPLHVLLLSIHRALSGSSIYPKGGSSPPGPHHPVHLQDQGHPGLGRDSRPLQPLPHL